MEIQNSLRSVTNTATLKGNHDNLKLSNLMGNRRSYFSLIYVISILKWKHNCIYHNTNLNSTSLGIRLEINLRNSWNVDLQYVCLLAWSQKMESELRSLHILPVLRQKDFSVALEGLCQEANYSWQLYGKQNMMTSPWRTAVNKSFHDWMHGGWEDNFPAIIIIN